MATQFDDFADVLKNMDPQYKQKLIESHQKFHQLRSWCEAKGYIETLPKLTGIRVLKMTKEVREMKRLIDTLQPGRFKWEDETKKKKA